MFASAVGVEPPSSAQVGTTVVNEDGFGRIVEKLGLRVGDRSGFRKLVVKPFGVGFDSNRDKSISRI